MRNKSEKVTLKVGVWRSEEDKERYGKTIDENEITRIMKEVRLL